MSLFSSSICFSVKPEGRSYLIRHKSSLYKFKIILNKSSSQRIFLMAKEYIQAEIQDVIRNVLWLESTTNSGDLPKRAVILTEQLAINIQKQQWPLSELIYLKKKGKEYFLYPFQYVFTVQCRKSWMEQKKHTFSHLGQKDIPKCKENVFKHRPESSKHSVSKKGTVTRTSSADLRKEVEGPGSSQKFSRGNADRRSFEKFNKENIDPRICQKYLNAFTHDLCCPNIHAPAKGHQCCCAIPEELLTSDSPRCPKCGGYYKYAPCSGKNMESSEDDPHKFQHQNVSTCCSPPERPLHSNTHPQQTSYNVFKSFFNALLTPIRMFNKT